MLTDKILEAVEQMDNAQGSWSIWEITQYLRNKYGAVADWEEEGVLFVLSHKYVRFLFEMMDWDGYDVIQDKPYRIFKKKGCLTTQPIFPNYPVAPNALITWQGIVQYLTNHGNKTAKQIQSALKTRGVKCTDIIQEAENNGAKVLTNPYPSKTVIGL